MHLDVILGSVNKFWASIHQGVIMEDQVIINAGEIRLEGKMNRKSGEKAVVVCHPHPLYGGDMNNPVVTAVTSTFSDKGYATLRFNFRGVGGSSGRFDDGIGEQEDIKAAVSMLRDMGYEQVTMAGYSFGSRINAQVVSNGYKIADHIMISPPAAFMSFSDISVLPSTGLIVTGEYDEYAPPDLIRTHIDRWQIKPRYEIIPGGDHFYSATLGRLKTILEDYLT